MRTTLDIDEDVLVAAKELARRQNLSAGQVVSQMLRKALTGQAGQSARKMRVRGLKLWRGSALSRRPKLS